VLSGRSLACALLFPYTHNDTAHFFRCLECRYRARGEADGGPGGGGVMDINRFTEKAQEALQAAQKIAARHEQQHVDVEHLLLALLQQEPGLAPAILRKANVNLDGLRQRAEREVDRLPKVGGATAESISPRLS